MRFLVIGITDTAAPQFSDEIRGELASHRLFSGGPRHHELVRPYLPPAHRWVDIGVPMSRVFAQWQAWAEAEAQATGAEPTLVVFASGDPLFFGIGATIRRQFPEAEVRVECAPHSLQLLARAMLLPYGHMHVVSLTGRPWQELDRALMERRELIGVLTDTRHTPAAIASRLRAYGYAGRYRLTVGERMGGRHQRVTTWWPAEMEADAQFERPCCVMLQAAGPLPPRPFGIADNEFVTLPGRPGMMTKMPIRLLTLQRLDLLDRQVLWDVGACTGSVSVEARLLFPHLQVEAFERREECAGIIAANAARHGAPGIGVHMGDFLAQPLADLPRPDAVFVGGHGGRLIDLLRRLLPRLLPGAVVVMNAVTGESERLFREAAGLLPFRWDTPMRVDIDAYHSIQILKMTYTGESL